MPQPPKEPNEWFRETNAMIDEVIGAEEAARIDAECSNEVE